MAEQGMAPGLVGTTIIQDLCRWYDSMEPAPMGTEQPTFLADKRRSDGILCWMVEWHCNGSRSKLSIVPKSAAKNPAFAVQWND